MIIDGYSRIIVTGANGWLGRRLVRALITGLDEISLTLAGKIPVRCLVPTGENTLELQELGTEVVRGDLRDSEAVQALFKDAEGALVLHLAGVIHPRRVSEFDEINVTGAENILTVSKTSGVARIVVMSSNSPFGANPSKDHKFTETSPYKPYMGYGRSKHRMELMMRKAMEHPGNPEIVIVRAPWFYGPGQPPRQTLFFSMIRSGRFPLVGDGQNRRSMGYVDTLAFGIMLCAARPNAAGNIFWLADERPYPMAEILQTVRDVLGQDFGLTVSDKRPQLPGYAADVARVIDAGTQGMGLYLQKVHVLSEMNLTIACDISRAREELGFEPLVELREGMRRSIGWCLENGHEI